MVKLCLCIALQWPGAYCDSRHSCCYPKTGKPAADFGIHGLWPNYKTGGWPQNCNPDSTFDELRVCFKLLNTLWFFKSNSF